MLISTNTNAVAQICPTTNSKLKVRMDLYGSYGCYPAGNNCENKNTNPQTSGLPSVHLDILNEGGSHVNSTQFPSGTATPHCNGWGRDVLSTNRLPTEVTTVAVGAYSNMNVSDKVEVNGQSVAILPTDFLPDKFEEDKAANNFFYRTYTYFFL